MSRNGSGVYSLPAGNPVVTNTTISSTWANTTLADIATALSGSLASDGQTPATGTLDMNSNKVSNLANGTLATDAINLGQLTTAFTNSTITGNLTVTGNGTFQGTGFLLIPKGTTAERPVSPVNGEIRYNTTTSQFEGYQGGAWGQLGGGATGGGGDTVFVENSRVVTTNYTIPVGKSAESVGPITINSGITVTVSSGERWVVL
jgi:hypothetical protein